MTCFGGKQYVFFRILAQQQYQQLSLSEMDEMYNIFISGKELLVFGNIFDYLYYFWVSLDIYNFIRMILLLFFIEVYDVLAE